VSVLFFTIPYLNVYTMARITYSGLVTAIRGSVGGTTFQANSYGYTIKNKPNQTRVMSLEQRVIRAALTFVTQSWLNLSSSNRAAWNSWANVNPFPCKHNSSSYLSGYAYFVRFNVTRYLFVGNILANPGGGSVVLPSLTPSLTVSGSDLLMNLAPSTPASDLVGYISCSPSQQVNRAYNTSKTRTIRDMLMLPGTFDVAPIFLQKFGSVPIAGDLVFFEILPAGYFAGHMYNSQFYNVTVV
jgi:hypothetical protein